MMKKTTGWRRSSRSYTGNCVEVSVVGPRVRIRDSKNPGQILDIPGRPGGQLFGYAKRDGGAARRRGEG